MGEKIFLGNTVAAASCLPVRISLCLQAAEGQLRREREELTRARGGLHPSPVFPS